MRIEVTEDDIREGTRLDCYECPVALAISRVTGSAAHVQGDVMLEGGRVVLLPESVLWRMNRYDAGEPMEPFSFDLSV